MNINTVNSKLNLERHDEPYLPAQNLSTFLPTRAEPKIELKRTDSYTPRHMPPLDPLSQYLARRDLVTSGLYQFDDKPENFCAWQSSFIDVVAEVQLTASQELDLMTKWLGKESSQQVRRMRSVYVNDPSQTLRKAWERLRDCYAAPEIIEQSLFQRLDVVQKISAKDHTKLRELEDLLMEIQGAKEDGYLTGLSHLDTSRGIGSIVDKFPYGLQEKWVSAGSRYKEENNGCFPPFYYFCDFVCHEAKKRNDLHSSKR